MARLFRGPSASPRWRIRAEGPSLLFSTSLLENRVHEPGPRMSTISVIVVTDQFQALASAWRPSALRAS